MTSPVARDLPPWRFVAWFGAVSLLADIVYEGARSVAGPYLATLGASAALVGAVTGAGEAFSLAGRLATGPLTDRTRAYWPLTISGYALTVAAVPLLGVTGVLWISVVLIIAERAGKAIRSPAKDVMLSHAASAVGRGRGFAVHEALDQIGAVAGPLGVAAVLTATGGDYRTAFLLLGIPGLAVLAVLLGLRARVPEPALYETPPALRETPPGHDSGTEHREPAAPRVPREPREHRERREHREGRRLGALPPAFWAYLSFTVVTTCGFATFGVLSFHLATGRVVSAAAVPVIYAAAMGVDALAALATGWAYDRVGGRVLAAVPVLTAAIPALAFSTDPATAIAGVMVWGAVLGVSESTMRAAVADLVPAERRGTAYGLFAAGYGAAAMAGGLLAGALYQHHPGTLVAVVAALQTAALALLLLARPHRPQDGPAAPH